MRPTSRSILITGAATGIGKAIVFRCLRANWRVIACDINDTALQRLPVEVNETMPELDISQQLATYLLDVADHAAVVEFFQMLEAHHELLYGLVNNAGIYFGKSLLDYTPAEIDRVMRVNCLGAVYCSQGFAQQLLSTNRTGVIVNIASVAGQDGSSDAIYGMPKAAVLGLTKSLALTLAPSIRVNAVAPALVSTHMLEHVPPSRLASYRAGELLPDPILPNDVADTVWFLLSEQSKHYTGASFDLNNGHYRR